MKKIENLSGQQLRDMFAAATGWLEKSAPDIDSLNGAILSLIFGRRKSKRIGRETEGTAAPICC